MYHIDEDQKVLGDHCLHITGFQTNGGSEQPFIALTAF